MKLGKLKKTIIVSTLVAQDFSLFKKIFLWKIKDKKNERFHLSENANFLKLISYIKENLMIIIYF